MHFYFTSKTNKPTKPFITILFCYISSYWPSDIRWSNSYVTQSLEDISDKKKGHAYLSWAKLVFLIVKHGLGGIAAKGALHHIDSRTNSPRRFEHRDELHCLKHRNPWVRKERDNVLLSIGTKLETLTPKLKSRHFEFSHEEAPLCKFIIFNLNFPPLQLVTLIFISNLKLALLVLRHR